MDYNDYLYSEPITVGGPAGNYTAQPRLNGAYYEYRVLNLAYGTNGGSAIIGTQKSTYRAIDTTGGTTYNDDTAINGSVYVGGAMSSVIGNAEWFEMPRDKALNIGINVSAGGAIYVTLQFRVRPITIIPGKAVQAPSPDDGHQLNIARSEKIIDHVNTQQYGLRPKLQKEKV